MRSDMTHVISDRPRFGARSSNKTAGKIPPSMLGDPPTDFPLNAINRRKRRETNIHFNPIERFLMSRVGRLWDRVYSEICSNADRRSHNGNRFISQVKDIVKTSCHLDSNRQPVSNDYGGYTVTGFYVHPITHLLCYMYQPKVRSSQEPNFQLWKRLRNANYELAWLNDALKHMSNYRFVDETHLLMKEEGIWYMATFALEDPDEIVGYDHKKFLSQPIRRRQVQPKMYMVRVSKRQLGKRELKEYRSLIEQ